MADESSTDTTGESTTEETTTDTTEATEQADDLAGLKAALAAERKAAKEGAKATRELEKLKAQHMTDQDKAIAKAKTEGATEAKKASGVKWAAAEFKAAALTAGADPSGVLDLIDMSKFLDEDGEVDTDAITKAVKGLPKTAQRGGGKSGGDFGGAPGGQPKSLAAQIRDAEAKGDTRESIRLKNLQLLNNNQ